MTRWRAVLPFLLAGCTAAAPTPPVAVPALPMGTSNNAVAVLDRGGGDWRLYSFFGLGAGKTWRDIHRRAFVYDHRLARWDELPPVPAPQGRLASTAATVQGRIYLFGGYTVAEDGHEVSTPDVFRFDPATRRYRKVAPLPVPVDDSVALVHRDRRVYLISGWHQDRNVALVQVYDAGRDTWSRATAYPGVPVFGHAGAILGDRLLVCDGVRLDVVDGKRRFSASDQCWRGEIDPAAPDRIAWRPAPSHPGPPRYRMGAAPWPAAGRLLFAGGSENPYNYAGTGYDGRPAPASARVQAFDLASERWRDLPPLSESSMDHRGLLPAGGGYFLIGGMRDPQRVSAKVLRWQPPERGTGAD